MNLLGQFLNTAEAAPEKAAIVTGDGRVVSFADLVAMSNAMAKNWERRGLRFGDRVLLAMSFGPELYAALAALWRIGAVAVLPEPAMGLKGLRHAARATSPAAYLSNGWFRLLGYALPELWRTPLKLTADEGRLAGDDMIDVGDGHPALISFTSGSTGRPKAIVRTHGFLQAQNKALESLLQPQREDEADLIAFPVFVVANLGMGVTSVLPNWNVRRHDLADPVGIAAHIEAAKVTRALVPPSICEAITRIEKAPKLDAIMTGGGPVYPDLIGRLSMKSRAPRIVAVYGSTEAEPIAHLDMREIDGRAWNAMRGGAGLLAGKPTPATRLEIIDDEIVVTGDHVNKGYLDPSDDASTKLRLHGETWHRTGDGGRIDELGRLWLTGRLDGRAAGLSPFCVEAAARTWPGLRRCALIERAGRAVLAVEGDHARLGEWKTAAARIGEIELAPLKAIPLDRRHRSKVDYVALRAALKDI